MDRERSLQEVENNFIQQNAASFLEAISAWKISAVSTNLICLALDADVLLTDVVVLLPNVSHSDGEQNSD